MIQDTVYRVRVPGYMIGSGDTRYRVRVLGYMIGSGTGYRIQDTWSESRIQETSEGDIGYRILFSLEEMNIKMLG